VQRQSARVPQETYDDPTIEKAAREEINMAKLARTNSTDSTASYSKMTGHGIPDDLEAEIDEIVAEVKAEIEQRRRRGSLMQGFEVKKAVQQKLAQFQKKA
jgi:lysophospholipid acyltransferase